MFKANKALFIYDSFIYDSEKYVILNNQTYSNPKLKNKLLLGRLFVFEKKCMVAPVDNSLYEELVNYYQVVKSAFMKEEQ